MANSFLDQLMGGGYAPSLGDLWGGPRAGASNSLNDLFGSPGGLAPSLSSLLGGVAPGPLAPSLGDLFGGVNPGAPSMAAGFAEIKAQQAAKEKALTAPQANANQPGTVNPQNPTSAPAAGAPSTSNYAFAQQHMPLAMQAIKTAGVDLDPAIPVAVAANETGWGQAAQGGQQWNSFHGIRGQGSAGQTPGGFQAYTTPQESYDAFVRLVTDPNGRYAPAYQAYQQSRDPRQFIQDLANAGYALAGQEADAWIPQVQGILPQVQAAWQSQPPSGAVQPMATAASPRSAQAQGILADAQHWVGVPYLWGGASRAGADCSGFISAVFQEMGMPFPGGRLDADGLRKVVQPVAPQAVQPGDLVFFHGTYGSAGPDYATHVGIVTQQGVMTDSHGNGVGTTQFLNSPYWQQHLIGYGRPPQYGQ